MLNSSARSAQFKVLRLNNPLVLLLLLPLVLVVLAFAAVFFFVSMILPLGALRRLRTSQSAHPSQTVGAQPVQKRAPSSQRPDKSGAIEAEYHIIN